MTMTTQTFAWHRMENILFSNRVKYKEQTQQVPISTTIFCVAYPKSWTFFLIKKDYFQVYKTVKLFGVVVPKMEDEIDLRSC